MVVESVEVLNTACILVMWQVSPISGIQSNRTLR